MNSDAGASSPAQSHDGGMGEDALLSAIDEILQAADGSLATGAHNGRTLSGLVRNMVESTVRSAENTVSRNGVLLPNIPPRALQAPPTSRSSGVKTNDFESNATGRASRRNRLHPGSDIPGPSFESAEGEDLPAASIYRSTEDAQESLPPAIVSVGDLSTSASSSNLFEDRRNDFESASSWASSPQHDSSYFHGSERISQTTSENAVAWQSVDLAQVETRNIGCSSDGASDHELLLTVRSMGLSTCSTDASSTALKEVARGSVDCCLAGSRRTIPQEDLSVVSEEDVDNILSLAEADVARVCAANFVDWDFVAAQAMPWPTAA
eukprot:TRINITY_DN11281_c0_g3_i1.p1 TRINITY_DN11281_c0_g3~~TRINITY_DN11281_c0_g3_i1.p1  ORF type:complete len:323 (-),score=65.77 TRINITY_DN11281_c0_g3_i1:163-1131(-)